MNASRAFTRPGEGRLSMWQASNLRGSVRGIPLASLILAVLCLLECLICLGCGGSNPANPHQAAHEISYSAIQDDEIWFRHSRIRLRFDSEMYCRVFFEKEGEWLSINDIPPDPAKAKPPHYLEVDGIELKDFNVDYRNVGMSEIKTQFGKGKCLHLTGYAKTPSGLQMEKSLTIEFYQDYPDMALLWVAYRNLEKDRAIRITKIVCSFFRLDAARAKAGTPSYSLWCFLGGKQNSEAFQISSENFAQAFDTGIEDGTPSRGAPLIDLWTAEMGMAIGVISPRPQRLNFPVQVAPDKKVEISLQSHNVINLEPNETLVTPKNFWMVHTGDFRTVQERHSTLIQRQN